MQPLFDDPKRTRARASAAMEALAGRPEVHPSRVAAIGFCFNMSLELARSGADLKAAVAGQSDTLRTDVFSSAASRFGGRCPSLPQRARSVAALADRRSRQCGGSSHPPPRSAADRASEIQRATVGGHGAAHGRADEGNLSGEPQRVQIVDQQPPRGRAGNERDMPVKTSASETAPDASVATSVAASRTTPT